MADLRYLARYFRVVSPVPALMTGSLVVATLAGLVVIAAGAERDGAVAIPLIVLQAFSASTGFSGPARRGHFDLLLARGEPRVRIALLQWLTAIVPGLAGWLVLALATTVTHWRSANPLVVSGTLVAMLMVSTIPWAVTVALPRFSGAIGWLLLISMGAMGGAEWPAAVRAVIFPVALAGQPLGHRPEVLAPAVLLSVVSVATALLWVHRADIPLEAAQ
jgi:hypothetical protein